MSLQQQPHPQQQQEANSEKDQDDGHAGGLAGSQGGYHADGKRGQEAGDLSGERQKAEILRHVLRRGLFSANAPTRLEVLPPLQRGILQILQALWTRIHRQAAFPILQTLPWLWSQGRKAILWSQGRKPYFRYGSFDRWCSCWSNFRYGVFRRSRWHWLWKNLRCDIIRRWRWLWSNVRCAFLRRWRWLWSRFRCSAPCLL